jgi:hypothetical protein
MANNSEEGQGSQRADDDDDDDDSEDAYDDAVPTSCPV